MPLTSTTSPKTTSLSRIDDDAFLYIPSDIYGQILGLCIGCDVEISGMGTLINYKGGYLVTKMYVGKQTCTAVETELSSDWLSSLEYEVLTSPHRNKMGDLSWWWHSHVDMPTFWSSTDMEAIGQMSGGKGGRIISTVFNRKRELRTSYSQGPSRDGYYPSIFQDELKTVIIPTDKILQEIQEKVTKETVSFNANQWGGHGKADDAELSSKSNIVEGLTFYYGKTRMEGIDMYDTYVNMVGHVPETVDEVYDAYQIFENTINNI